MTDSQWTDDAPPKKKGVPTWIWACGAGCFVLLVLGVIGAVFAVRFVKDAADPERQWPKVREILYFDERPQDITMIMGLGFFGFETYVMTDGHLILAVMRMNEAQEAEAKKLMDPTVSGGFANVGKRRDMEAGTMELLGDERKVLHYYQSSPGQSQQQGQSVLVDISDEFPGGTVLLQFTRAPGASAPENPEEGPDGSKITQREVAEFLRPFSLR